jgi:hypothetical protein
MEKKGGKNSPNKKDYFDGIKGNELCTSTLSPKRKYKKRVSLLASPNTNHSSPPAPYQFP